jgi:hypothetical protein
MIIVRLLTPARLNKLSAFPLRSIFVAAVMPKELRKRGKRHRKSAADHQTPAQEQEQGLIDDGPSSGPSWIVPREDSKQVNPEAPFGYVDPEIKAYFRTFDDQLKEWQQNWDGEEGDEDIDPNESALCLSLCFAPRDSMSSTVGIWLTVR